MNIFELQKFLFACNPLRLKESAITSTGSCTFCKWITKTTVFLNKEGLTIIEKITLVIGFSWG
jgi:hypothetical protein